MRVTANRKTDLNDLKLNQPERFSLKKTDSRPHQFSTPTYNPLTPETLSVVHPPNSTKGGFFGDTRTDKTGGKKFHAGLDIHAEVNTGILAAESGEVALSQYLKGYGNVIYVNHPGGYQTRYAHLNELNVKKGDLVSKGEMIGSSGKTGNADSPSVLPHLHFEIRKIHEDASPGALGNDQSTPLDPLEFLTTDPLTKTMHLVPDGDSYRSAPTSLPPWIR